uniref:Uncharacterized protein n=1 Tax=Chromera velia CCMP2878 TaxID=1169474 RepID=A0A0G4GU39_9ALVE|eukprot:Cvel_23385.t1-p1 / transcript=Cvel_23385.t1 / gene=Cvel_23385 / organism=Chromera_velia_CCMP2878 / gene_product=hypothetical protein / transcript_product=hypothetical protein / location=Cvel_scaffold2404:2252-3144(-) / protein_length=248 / sequence_SO=supercontig / SO=protein_coding / is_pseudo=false
MGKWVIEIELSRCEWWDGVGCGNVHDICMAFGFVDPLFRFLRKGKTPPMTMMIIHALSEATVGFTLVDHLVKLTLDLHKKPIDIPFGSGPGAVTIRVDLSNTVFLLADYKSHRERGGIVGGTSWWRSPWTIVAAFLYYATVRVTEEEVRPPSQHQETLQRFVVEMEKRVRNQRGGGRVARSIMDAQAAELRRKKKFAGVNHPSVYSELLAHLPEAAGEEWMPAPDLEYVIVSPTMHSGRSLQVTSVTG